LITLRFEVLEFQTAVILWEIIKLASSEIPERLQEGRSDVVSIAVQPSSVVLVYVDGGVDKLDAQVLRVDVVLEPTVEETTDLWIPLRLLLCQNMPSTIRNEAHGVGVDECLAFLHHVLPGFVYTEVPKAQHLQDLEVRDLVASLVRMVKELLRLSGRRGTPRHHHGRLPEADRVVEAVHVSDVQLLRQLDLPETFQARPLLLEALLEHLDLLGAGGLVVPRLGVVGIPAQNLFRVRQGIDILHGEDVEGLVPQRSKHLQVALLVVEQKVCR